MDCKLADDLLIEILLRLSSGDVARFKSVCKHWNSLISSVDFVTLFNRRRNETSSPTEYSLLFQFQRSSLVECNEYYSPVFHYGSGGVVQRVRSLDLSFVPNSSPNMITINSSCGDLILCSHYDIFKPGTIRFYVCNLRNKQCLALILCSHYDRFKPGTIRFYVCNPRNKQCLALPGLSLSRNHGLGLYDIGLLYLPSRPDKFAVVLNRIISITFMPSSPIIEVVLFSSDEGRWRELVISSPKDGLRIGHDRLGKNLFPYKGKLHWVNYPYILVYDPYNDPSKISRVIRMQMERDNDNASFRSAGVFQDRIRVTYTTSRSFGYPKFHSVWELEVYGMGKWRMVKKVIETDMKYMCGYVLPNGNKLCEWKNCGCLWLENLQQSNGVAVDNKDHECEHHDLSLICTVNVNQIDFNWLPTPLPYLIWPYN